jgi:hypothetical protein
MNNDRKVYAIRNLGFWYDDEYYFPLLTSDSEEGQICALSEDKESAIQAWKRLEYEFSHQYEFINVYQYEGFGYELEQIGIELDNIFFDKLKRMSQDELFDIIYKLNRNVYFLYEYPADLKVKVLWETNKNNYFIYDELIWGDRVFAYTKTLAAYLDSNGVILIRGSLEELTDAPLLLSQLIEQDPNLDYMHQHHILTVKPDEQSLNSVNSLLKNPLYEIRYLTIQEIYEIEQTLNHTEPR